MSTQDSDDKPVRECIVAGCHNAGGEGTMYNLIYSTVFVGRICAPCLKMLQDAKLGPSDGFLGELKVAGPKQVQDFSYSCAYRTDKEKYPNFISLPAEERRRCLGRALAVLQMTHRDYMLQMLADEVSTKHMEKHYNKQSPFVNPVEEIKHVRKLHVNGCLIAAEHMAIEGDLHQAELCVVDAIEKLIGLHRMLKGVGTQLMGHEHNDRT